VHGTEDREQRGGAARGCRAEKTAVKKYGENQRGGVPKQGQTAGRASHSRRKKALRVKGQACAMGRGESKEEKREAPREARPKRAGRWQSAVD